MLRLLLPFLFLSLAQGAKPNDEPFVDAFLKGDFEKAKHLLEEGADVDTKTINGGYSPMEHAAMYGMARHLLFLKQNGAKTQDPALIAAILNFDPTNTKTGKLEIVKLLLDIGASPNAEDKFGRSALYWAAKKDDKAVLKLLLTKGAKPTFYNQMMLCPAQGYPETIQLFLEKFHAACKCPAGTKIVSNVSEGQFERWCRKGKLKTGPYVSGDGDGGTMDGVWGDWHPSSVREVKFFKDGKREKSYSCQGVSCRETK